MLRNILTIFFISYIFFFLMAYLLSNRLIFIPPNAGYRDDPNILKIKTASGREIAAVYLPNKEAQYTVLFSHGNAEDIGYMTPFLQDMYSQGFSVFAYDYAGYGLSEGSSSEKRSYEDIEAAYDYLTRVVKIPAKNIIFHGRSLGSAVSLDLAIRKPAAAIIMETPFVTAFRVLTILPFFPFDKFNNLAKIKKLTIPLLIIHGQRDTIVPIWHSKKLYHLAKVDKQNFWVPLANHNDIWWQARKEYWEVILKFVRSL